MPTAAAAAAGKDLVGASEVSIEEQAQKATSLLKALERAFGCHREAQEAA